MCGCSEDVHNGYIAVPQGDDCLIVFSSHENDSHGSLFDISGAIEIVFIVADELGGTVRITKRMSDGDIAISTNLYQFYFTVTDTETASLVRQTNYFECQITSSVGLKKTVRSGVFKAIDTMIKDIP